MRDDTITEADFHLLNEGTHRRLGDVLGAKILGERGVRFAVWAPNAARVAVVGDFNGWDADADPLEVAGVSGVWQGVVPGARPGQVYKYLVSSASGEVRLKADPVAHFAEIPPKTGSVVWDLSYSWDDEQWMASRAERLATDAAISIYELHLGSWRRDPSNPGRLLSCEEIAEPLISHAQRCGFTHVELLPVMEHPYFPSWGYQTTGYFAPTSRYGTPQDLMRLIDELHQADIGVILDWVPSHFAADDFALARFDGTHLYEHADLRLGFHPDWKSLLFNYGRHEVRSFLASSAGHWISKYHIDGIRVDAVASMLYLDYSRAEGEWIPNEHGGRENLEAIEFLRQLNEGIAHDDPSVAMIAEESTGWPGVTRPVGEGGLGFRFTWDLGWMHDTLGYLEHNPVHRRWHHHDLTFRSIYACNERYVLPLSHDEVVHLKGSLVSKMPGDRWQQMANVRLLSVLQATQPGKKLLFMGDEFGALREWDQDQSLDWDLVEHPAHAGLLALVADLNALYRSTGALHELDSDPAGFSWVLADDQERSCYAYLRRGVRGDLVLCALNATPVPRFDVGLDVPVGGRWLEILNSDAAVYGGSGVGNLGGLSAVSHNSGAHRLSVTVPPLGAVLLTPEEGVR